MHRRRTLAAALTALAVACTVCPAALAAHLEARPVHRTITATSATANGASQMFAGWTFLETGSTSVVSAFRLPAKPWSCHATQTGVGPGAEMVTGTTAVSYFNAAILLVGCAGGKPFAKVEISVDGQPTYFTPRVYAGDSFAAAVSTNAIKTTVVLRDTTPGHAFLESRSGIAHPAIEELIAEDSINVCTHASCTALPALTFGEIDFVDGSVGGKPLGTVTPRTAWNMVSAGNVAEILTGPLTGKDADAFTTTSEPQPSGSGAGHRSRARRRSKPPAPRPVDRRRRRHRATPNTTRNSRRKHHRGA